MEWISLRPINMRRKSTYKQSSAALLVILLGMSVLVYHTAQTYVNVLYVSQVKAKEDSSTKKDKQSSEKQVYASPDVILSVSSIHLDQEFYQIKEIVFGAEEDSEDIPHVTEHYTSYFRTLFRQVISPNAP